MKPYYADEAVTLYHGDCIAVMRELPDASVDAVVTDPPYGLGFMGKEWDAFGGVGGITDPQIRARQQEKWGTAFGASARPAAPAPGEMQKFQSWCTEWATEALRVLKPGGHLLAFGGTRTWHRLACAIEDAGFEVRDSIAWMYGSGFPKSLDVSKAIDKAAGAERTVRTGPNYKVPNAKAVNPHFIAIAARREDQPTEIDYAPTAPATPAAQQWQGWGTALKPAHEPIVVARKPLIGTVAENVLAHGTGAINVDGCRIPIHPDDPIHGAVWTTRASKIGLNSVGFVTSNADGDRREADTSKGRWPANVILDESQAAELDKQSGVLTSGKMMPTHTNAERKVFGQNADGGYTTMETYGDTGGASRFFYTAKADSNERPSYVKTVMRMRSDLTEEQAGQVLAALREAGVQVD